METVGCFKDSEFFYKSG